MFVRVTTGLMMAVSRCLLPADDKFSEWESLTAVTLTVSLLWVRSYLVA